MRTKFLPFSLPLALLASAANGIEMTDYTDPESKWEEAYLSALFNSNSGNQDQTSFDLTVDAFYDHNYSSLPRTWRVHIDGKADISRGASKEDETKDNSSVNFRANLNNYFKARKKTFWYGETEANYKDEADNIKTQVGLGIGYGRVINATPLAKVLRIEEELREHGVILGRMNDEEYLELAQIIDRENEYIGKFGSDEYKSHWISDFEEILKRIGVLRNGALGAIGVLQMNKVLFDEIVSVRKHGWLVSAGIGYVVQNFDEENDSDPSIDLAYEYTHPSGYKGQFINRLDYSYTGDETDQELTNQMSYSHEISDRIDWVNTWTLNWEKFEGNKHDVLENGLSTTFLYYLTNRVTANATVSATKTDDGIANDANDNREDDNDDTDVTTFFSITYRLK